MKKYFNSKAHFMCYLTCFLFTTAMWISFYIHGELETQFNFMNIMSCLFALFILPRHMYKQLHFEARDLERAERLKNSIEA